MSERNPTEKARAALTALYLELEPSIARDVGDLVEAAFTFVRSQALAEAADALTARPNLERHYALERLTGEVVRDFHLGRNGVDPAVVAVIWESAEEYWAARLRMAGLMGPQGKK